MTSRSTPRLPIARPFGTCNNAAGRASCRCRAGPGSGPCARTGRPAAGSADRATAAPPARPAATSAHGCSHQPLSAAALGVGAGCAGMADRRPPLPRLGTMATLISAAAAFKRGKSPGRQPAPANPQEVRPMKTIVFAARRGRRADGDRAGAAPRRAQAPRRRQGDDPGRGRAEGAAPCSSGSMPTATASSPKPKRRRPPRQRPQRHRQGAGMRGHHSDPAAMFEKMDTDRNGQISRAEFDAMHAKRGERMGGDAARCRGHGRGFGGHMFAMADLNKDGRVSLQEATSAVAPAFQRRRRQPRRHRHPRRAPAEAHADAFRPRRALDAGQLDAMEARRPAPGLFCFQRQPLARTARLRAGSAAPLSGDRNRANPSPCHRILRLCRLAAFRRPAPTKGCGRSTPSRPPSFAPNMAGRPTRRGSTGSAPLRSG